MIRSYLLRHAQVLFYSLGQLVRTPIATLMTLLVIAITLVLPTGLYLVLDNLKGLSGSLGDSARITLFLDKDIKQSTLDTLLTQIKKNPGIKQYRYLDPGEALRDFREISGFGSVMDQLKENPLPGVILVIPSSGLDDLEQLQRLVSTFEASTGVDFAQLDSQWIQRLRGLLALGTRATYVLAMLLGLGVLLVIGNTIRLAVLNRRREIEIIKLVGGTDAFVRRPFLYTGTLQGAIGATIAVALVYSVLASLSGPIAQLSHAYGTQLQVHGLGIRGSALLIGAGGVLGWLGARLAVWRHLRDIEPD